MTSSYGFKITKRNYAGDLYVHIWFNSGGGFGKPLGKYIIPSLEPLPRNINFGK